MKRFIPITALVAALIIAGCAPRETIRARTMLSKCGFEIESIDLQLLEFAPAITFDANSRRFNIAKPDIAGLQPLLAQLQARKFSLQMDSLCFTVRMKVHNPNNHAVTLDRMKAAAALDGTHLADIEHQDYEEIPALGTQTVPVQVTVPAGLELQQLLAAQDITLKGNVWLRLNVSGKMGVIIPLPLSVTRPVPRNAIKKAIKKEQGRIVRELSKVLITDELLDKAGQLFK